MGTGHLIPAAFKSGETDRRYDIFIRDQKRIVGGGAFDQFFGIPQAVAQEHRLVILGGRLEFTHQHPVAVALQARHRHHADAQLQIEAFLRHLPGAHQGGFHCRAAGGRDAEGGAVTSKNVGNLERFYSIQ